MTYRIGLLEGDYIGPEIIRQAVKALKACGRRFGYEFELVRLPVSGEAYDLYGEPLPQSTVEAAKTCHALLKGPFGGPTEEINHPKWAGVEAKALLPLRKIFNLYTNLRETKIYRPLINLSPLKPEYLENVGILIVRELVSGIYFGEKGERIVNGERQFYDVEAYAESEIARVAKVAFETARARRNKVTLVAKSNVLRSSALWREVVEDVRRAYADVEFDYMHVDNAAMQCVLNPAQFDVILTSNMFGDILSDEVSVLSGSIGLFPSASLNGTDFGLYEPIHGSAPSIAGKNIANPLSAILCVPLLFTHTVHDAKAAAAVDAAVEKALEDGYRTKDLFRDGDDPEKLLGTEEFGDLIAEGI
ncbi:MAG: 3-isopropylmalate dehydrogenase [Firmicutes bacterium]|nr:3-isopropylmalate dehydrogenase [Bacillota bacterium]